MNQLTDRRFIAAPGLATTPGPVPAMPGQTCPRTPELKARIHITARWQATADQARAARPASVV